MLKKSNTALLGGLLALFILASCSKPNAEKMGSDEKVVRIGISTALSGNLAFVGTDVRHGVLLAAEDLSKGKKYRYEFVFEDDQMEPRKAVVNARKLIDVDHVDALISTWHCGNAIAPVAESQGVSHVSLAWSSEIAKTGKYNFNNYTSPRRQVPFLINHLKAKGFSKAAILQVNDPGSKEVAAIFIQEAAKAGISVVTHQTFSTQDRDFRTMISKARESNPDIYLLLAFSPAMELIGRQLKEAGVTTPLTSVENFDDTEEPKWFEGQEYVGPAVGPAEFRKRYEAKFQSKPLNAAAFAYTAVELIAHAYEDGAFSSKPTHLQVCDFLNNLRSFSSTLGDLENDGEGYFDSKPVLKRIEDNKHVVLD